MLGFIVFFLLICSIFSSESCVWNHLEDNKLEFSFKMNYPYFKGKIEELRSALPAHGLEISYPYNWHHQLAGWFCALTPNLSVFTTVHRYCDNIQNPLQICAIQQNWTWTYTDCMVTLGLGIGLTVPTGVAEGVPPPPSMCRGSPICCGPGVPAPCCCCWDDGVGLGVALLVSRGRAVQDEAPPRFTLAPPLAPANVGGRKESLVLSWEVGNIHQHRSQCMTRNN